VHLMHSFVDRLTDDHIADVAAYFASLESPP
jgi:cytochrome c553